MGWDVDIDIFYIYILYYICGYCGLCMLLRQIHIDLAAPIAIRNISYVLYHRIRTYSAIIHHIYHQCIHIHI